MAIPFDLQTFVIAAATVGAAYVVFGISAFGAALFTVPILSHFFPLDFVLPLCVLLDVSAALTLGARFSRTRTPCAQRFPTWCCSRLRSARSCFSRADSCLPTASPALRCCCLLRLPVCVPATASRGGSRAQRFALHERAPVPDRPLAARARADGPLADCPGHVLCRAGCVSPGFAG